MADKRTPTPLEPMHPESRRMLLIEALRSLQRARLELDGFQELMRLAGYHSNTEIGESYYRVWDLLNSRVQDVQHTVEQELKRV